MSQHRNHTFSDKYPAVGIPSTSFSFSKYSCLGVMEKSIDAGFCNAMSFISSAMCLEVRTALRIAIRAVNVCLRVKSVAPLISLVD